MEEHDEQANLPKSYTSNNKKEKTLIGYARNFQRQFRQLYGDRKLLLLTPLNEYNIEKFVCTTLRPTQTPHKEVYDFEGCASFVADYLTYKCLSIPNELPKQLQSPTVTVSSQLGNCFDYSVLLTSLLIGAGYDAYCVCGYATREVTLLDQSRNVCPLLVEKPKNEDGERNDKRLKYTAKPPKSLTSTFLRDQKKKEEDRLTAEEEKKKEEEAARIAELEKPPPDKYYGLRYHCWVLVLPGKREVGQGFFIEATTGEVQALDWDQYLGMESLWNHRNVWVNMQDCSEGVANLVYDLGDATLWEYFFPNVDKPRLLIPGQEVSKESLDEEEENEVTQDHFELPPSWVDPLVLPDRGYEKRYPNGVKTLLYYKSKVEKFAPYLNQDGLVQRITQYRDSDRKERVTVREEYTNREDQLYCRVTNVVNGQITEYFKPGKPTALQEHSHFGHKGFKSHSHITTFYHNARVDGLARREVTMDTLTEKYTGRADKMESRDVIYCKPVKRFEPAEKDRAKQIQRITERFSRNPALPPNQDVAERVFGLEESKVTLTYHLEGNRVTRSTREFYLPSVGEGQPLTMNTDMTASYQVDSSANEPKQRVLYEILERLVADQEKSTRLVRASEKEMEDILSVRHQEELNTVLTISVYDVDRNEKARLHKQEQERLQEEEERVRREKEKDYLAPFLARLGDKDHLTTEEKERVKEDCLRDAESRQEVVANIIQAHFERESKALVKKQSWYKNKQSSINKDEEEEYVSYCSDALFRLHILEQRLNSHKMKGEQKYLMLERKLQTDPRLY